MIPMPLFLPAYGMFVSTIRLKILIIPNPLLAKPAPQEIMGCRLEIVDACRWKPESDL